MFIIIACVVMGLTYAQTQKDMSGRLETRNCSGSILKLECDANHQIEIINVMKGTSKCKSLNCCPDLKIDSTKIADYNRKQTVKKACLERSSCFIKAEDRKFWWSPDYEIISWICQPPKTTTTTTITPTIKDDTTFFNFPSTLTRTAEETSILHEYKLEKDETGHVTHYSEPKYAAQAHRDYTVPGNTHLIKIVNLESIVGCVIAGIIFVTLIISIACLVSKRYRFRTHKMELMAMSNNANGVYLQPMRYNDLLNNSDFEPNSLKYDRNYIDSTEVDKFETYDVIGMVDDKITFEDGYLKPNDLIIAQLNNNIRNNSNLYSEEETGRTEMGDEDNRYVLK